MPERKQSAMRDAIDRDYEPTPDRYFTPFIRVRTLTGVRYVSLKGREGIFVISIVLFLLLLTGIFILYAGLFT